MSKHVSSARVGLTLATGVAALALAACGSSGPGVSGGSSVTPSSPAVAPTTLTQTVTQTETVRETAPAPTTQPATSSSPTAVASTSGSATTAARGLAVQACRTWKRGDTQSAAVGSGTYDQAAKTAKKAAQAASDYTQLSTDMTFVSGLPLTSNTQADVAKAGRAVARIAPTCKALGVPGIRQA